MENKPKDHGRAEYFAAQGGQLMSIQTAALRGYIRRGEDEDAVIINGITMPARAAVEAGLIDVKAAAYMATRPGPIHKFIREDAAPPPKPPQAMTSAALVEALGAFLTQPTLLGKQIAVEALEAHLNATK